MTAEQEALVLNNLRFVDYLIGKQFHIKNTNPLWEDMKQEGYLALCEAAIRFDSSRGIKFIAYAHFWVRKLLGDFLRKNALISLPPVKALQAFRENTPRHFAYLRLDHPDTPPLEAPPQSTIEDRSKRRSISKAVRRLPERHRYVVIKRFGLQDDSPLSLESIGQHLDLSREYVRILESQALENLTFRLSSLKDSSHDTNARASEGSL